VPVSHLVVSVGVNKSLTEAVPDPVIVAVLVEIEITDVLRLVIAKVPWTFAVTVSTVKAVSPYVFVTLVKAPNVGVPLAI
jgi:hypothetical protein